MKHLVLVHTERYQEVGDWHEIAGYAAEWADDIEVFVVDNQRPDPAQIDRIAAHPTFVFSPVPLLAFQPPRGKVYQGRNISKFKQLHLLDAHGVPIPPTAVIKPGLILDPAQFGSVVVVKPDFASRGREVRLARTECVRYRSPEDYPEGHPGRERPMLAQSFVYTGPHLSSIRVLTLFGAPLYAYERRCRVPMFDIRMLNQLPSLAATQAIPPELLEYVPVASRRVLKLASKVYRAIPDVPLQGVDILQNAQNGRLCVIEINAGGNTWHFSSTLGKLQAAGHPGLMKLRRGQFDAFRTAARVLVERTRAEAA